MGILGYTGVYKGILGYTWAYMGIHGYTRVYLSNRPHFRWVYRRDKPCGMLGEHEKSL